MCEGVESERIPRRKVAMHPQVPQMDEHHTMTKKPSPSRGRRFSRPAFLSWRPAVALRIARAHPLLVFLTINFALVIPLEYSMSMVAPGGEPFDAGFLVTERLHKLLKHRPAWNHVLAAANTVLVLYQIAYIAWVWVVEGRFRPTLASLFMYSSRGLLGYSTQLPVPQDFLGSEVDFPVGNVSFFLFFSGHVGASLIATMDLRHMQRRRAALIMDTLNILQIVRLLATRGHYTIDLVAGAFAGWACYYVAGVYQEKMLINVSGASSVADSTHEPLKPKLMIDS